MIIENPFDFTGAMGDTVQNILENGFPEQSRKKMAQIEKRKKEIMALPIKYPKDVLPEDKPSFSLLLLSDRGSHYWRTYKRPSTGERFRVCHTIKKKGEKTE